MWAMAASRIVWSCFMSPENERATKLPPSSIASEQQSMGARSLTVPSFSFAPRSAVAENWPFVRPYTPLSSMM